MVPTPNSYSRLICSKSSTLFLLVIGGLHDSGLLSQRGESSRDEVGQIRAPKWPESECQNQLLHSPVGQSAEDQDEVKSGDLRGVKKRGALSIFQRLVSLSRVRNWG